jgi:hypothetical protein
MARLRPDSSPTLLKRMLFAMLLASGVSGEAQSVIDTSQMEPALAAYLRRQNSEPPPLSRLPPAPSTPYQFAGITLHTRVNYTHMMAEGLPVRGGRRVSSEIRTFSPGIWADLGEHWTLEYSPSWTSYTARALGDSFDQLASLSGAASVRDWSFQVSQSYSDSSPTLIETARQTEQQVWNTSVSATYRYSDKMQLQATGGLNQRNVKDETLTDLRSWSAGAAVKYQISPKLGVNFGPDFYYTEVADAPDTFGGGVDARFAWQLSNKLNAGIGAGWEYTQSTATEDNDLANPRFNFSLGYHPFETTSITLNATRSTSTSFFRNRAIESMRWSVGLNQRFLQRFYFGANYNRGRSDYTALTTVALADRSDTTESYSMRLSTRLLKRLSTAVVWRKNENTSNTSEFNFSSTQYGIELGYQY